MATGHSSIEVPYEHFLAHDLKKIYNDQHLADVKLKTNSNSFPAHKVILSAFSPVFRDIFSRSKKENGTECVCVEESDDTVSRMLNYMYTLKVEDLTWESAIGLYSAADKYALVCLKETCTSFIKDNMDINNACDVLLLSEKHTDDELGVFVREKYGKDLTWESAIESYPLASKYDMSFMKKISASVILDNLTISNVCEALLLARTHQDEELIASILEKLVTLSKDTYVADYKWRKTIKKLKSLSQEVQKNKCTMVWVEKFCISFMKDMKDTYFDEELKAFALDYIDKRGENITNWEFEVLLKSKQKQAAEDLFLELLRIFWIKDSGSDDYRAFVKEL